jgi:lysophospholipase L1-like esterase
MKAYLGTLLPIYGWRTYAPFREDLKNNVNDWMRSYSEADGCIDFDLALRDAKNPTAFRDGYDSGDHLHPSSLAYKVMADTVPDTLLK